VAQSPFSDAEGGNPPVTVLKKEPAMLDGLLTLCGRRKGSAGETPTSD
jgi:hypothetical protein